MEWIGKNQFNIRYFLTLPSRQHRNQAHVKFILLVMKQQVCVLRSIEYSSYINMYSCTNIWVTCLTSAKGCQFLLGLTDSSDRRYTTETKGCVAVWFVQPVTISQPAKQKSLGISWFCIFWKVNIATILFLSCYRKRNIKPTACVRSPSMCREHSRVHTQR